MSELSERVSKGAKYLDNAYPDWAYKIDMGYLDMMYGDSCILGQLNQDYSDTLDKWDISYQDAYEHGFTVLNESRYIDPNIDAPRSEWDELGTLWEQEITSRR